MYTKRVSCHFKLTIELPDIVAIYVCKIYAGHATPELNCGARSVEQFAKGSLADNLPNFPTSKVSLHTVVKI